MRTIKFRGKRTDNGEWVYGYYTHGIDIKTNKVVSVIANNFNPKKHTYNSYEVIPETVGQFTGLLDKNGNEIYEGDMVRFTYHPVYGANNVIEAPVIFLHGKFGYSTEDAVQVNNPDNWRCKHDFVESTAFALGKLGEMESGWADKSGVYSEMFEVVDNIHDLAICVGKE